MEQMRAAEMPLSVAAGDQQGFEIAFAALQRDLSGFEPAVGQNVSIRSTMRTTALRITPAFSRT